MGRIFGRVVNGVILENNRELPFIYHNEETNSDTSFGINETDEVMATYNYYPVVGTEPPHDSTAHRNNGTSYIFDGKRINKVYDIQPIPLDDLKSAKIQTIKDTTDLKVPVTINGVTFNGGEASASAISGAYQLAQLNQEPNVQLWDINNSVATYSLLDAEQIAKAIAVDYRTKALARQARIMAVNAITIDLQGTYPDYASAKEALDLI